MRKWFVFILVLAGISCLVGCTLSMDFHPEGKNTKSSSK